MSESGGPPAPGKPKTMGERIGSIAALIVVLTIFAGVAGFASDLIVWAWEIGKSIIH